MPFCLRISNLVMTVLIGLAISAESRAGTPSPSLSAIQPAEANVGGGNSVLITGTNLSSITSVTFDGLPATIIRQDANSLFVTTPPHAPGTVAVVASQGGRRMTGALELDFTYADDFDAGRDFSAVQNPIGAWTYGRAAGMTQAFNGHGIPGIVGCVDTWSGSDDFPVIGRNRTGSECNQYSWSWPAGMIGIHPDNSPEYGVIRFTAPDTARYVVDGRFLCIDHVANCSIDVVILHNMTTTMFARNITASFMPETFDFPIELEAGDTVDFRVGNGGNTYNYDQMVLDAHIHSESMLSDGFEGGD